MSHASARRGAAFALIVAVLWMLLPLVLLRLPLWDWPIPDWPRLTMFLLGFVAAFALGGVLALATMRRLSGTLADKQQNGTDNPTGRAASAIFVVTILMNFATLFVRASFNPFTCGSILECSNAAYQGYVEGSLTGEGVYFEYLRILLSPIIYAGVAMSIWSLFFPEGRKYRRFAYMIIISEVILAIATGTARSMANLLLFGLLVRALRSQDSETPRRTVGQTVAIVGGGALLIILFFLYFSFLQLNRDGLVAAVGLMPFAGGYVEALSFQTSSDNFLLKGFESVVRYLCTGYFSFSLALGLSAGHTFPLGASVFLAQRAMRGGDPTFVTHSLPGQIESHYGWSYAQQWHSIFSWLMSDYPAPVVAAFMLAIGWAFTLSIFVALSQEGPIAKMPMLIFFIMVLYVPANNQVFQSPELLFSFFSAVLLLLFKVAQMQRPQTGLASATG